MTIGTLYGYTGSNSYKTLVAAKYNDITVDFKETLPVKDTKTEEFLGKFPLGKVPAFEGKDGLCLIESNAIAYYVANAKEGTTLLGANKKQNALIQSYIALTASEFGPIKSAWLGPIFGYSQYNEAATQKATTNAKRTLAYLNTQLATRTFFVGERLTLADIVLACSLKDLYETVFDPKFMTEYKHVTRWFKTCVNQTKFKSVIGEVKYVETAMVAKKTTESAPKAKKEAAPKVKKEAAPKATPAADEKPKKNPLDLLPKSSFVLDEWKRFYSNNETRPDAINWFWDHFDPTGYSIWKVDYKYNDELTQVFMSSNLVGGFFQRLERARKYAFGSVVILGENNKNEITGYFVIRGSEVPFEVSDSADYESYSFVKVDHSDKKVKEDVDAVFAWDDKIRGLACADGKIFK